MKRPLVVITAGFVLGEVLALCLQEAVYRKCFWFAGALFLAALIARHFLGKDQDRYLGRDQNRDLAGNSGRSVTYRILLLIFMFIFSGMSAGSFLGVQFRNQMDREEDRIAQAEFGDVVQLTGQVMDVREKSEKLEIIVNKVKIQWLTLQFPVQLYGVPGELENWEESLLPGKKVKIACSLNLAESEKNPGEFNAKLYYRSKGVVCTGYIKALNGKLGGGPALYACYPQVQKYCSRILEQYCEKEDSSIYKAVLLGDTSFMEADTLDLYRSSGIAHLLAVSGQHLSLIGGGIYLLLRKTIGGFKAAGILGGSFVISYGIFTGSGGSACPGSPYDLLPVAGSRTGAYL